MKQGVTLYTRTACPVCGMVRDYLSNMDIAFKEINIDFHPGEMVKLVGRTWRLSVPQTNIYGKWVFGYDPVKLLKALNHQGE
jgi:glutaredoxin